MKNEKHEGETEESNLSDRHAASPALSLNPLIVTIGASHGVEFPIWDVCPIAISVSIFAGR